MPKVVALLIGAQLLGLVGCHTDSSEDRDAGAHIATMDEAQVETVTITHPPASYTAVGEVASQANVTIGAADGDPVFLFGSVESVRQSPNGDIVVADGQAREIRRFDQEGSPLVTLGRSGDGPGEFRLLSLMPLLTTDSVWVWDRRQLRITVFESDGRVAEVVSIDWRGELLPTEVNLLPDGLMLVASPAGAPSRFRSTDTFVLQRDSIVFTRYDAAGVYIDTLMTLPSTEYAQHRFVAGGGDIPYALTARLPFARGMSYAALLDLIVGGPNDRFVLEWRDLNGRLRRVTRLPSFDRLVTTDEVRALRSKWLDEAGTAQRQIDMVNMAFDEFPIPEFHPAFDRILVDGGRRVWVREQELFDDSKQRWWYFEPGSGAPLGFVDTPGDLDIHQFGEDYILGVSSDELGVQYIRRHYLRMYL